MYLDEASELFAYWGRNPPLRDLVAGFLGVEPVPRDKSSDGTSETPTEFEFPEFE